MTCANCGGLLNEFLEVLLNCDGDFACSEGCAQAYREKRDYFIREVLVDDKKFANYFGVSVDTIAEDQKDQFFLTNHKFIDYLGDPIP